MSYLISYSRAASKFLLGAEQKTAGRIIKKLEAAAKNPARYFSRLSGREELKMRIGSYRLIAQVSHSEKLIIIQDIGHRKYVYKKK